MRVKNSITNIMSGLVGQLILTLTSFITRTVFIKMLGQTYLGVSGLFSNVLSILSFAELGIGQAIIFSLYKPIAENDEDKICALMRLYARVYRLLFLFVLTVGLLLLPFLRFIVKDIDAVPNLRLIYVMYVANSAFSYLFSYRGTFLTACQKNYIVNTVSFLSSILMAAVQILCLYLFRNYLVYLSIQILFGVLMNLFSYFCASRLYPFLKRKNIPPLEKNELAKITENVRALIYYKVGTLALNSTDNLLITSFVGIIVEGLYSNYLLLQTTVTGVLSTIFGNLTASIGNLNAQESDEKKEFMFRVINLVTFWFYAVCSICLFVCMSPFIHVWIGDDYLLPTSVSLIIAINTYIAGMLFAPYNYRQTMGLFVYGKLRPIISAVINLVVSIWFASMWGLTGVLWGTAVARLTTNAWYDPYLVYRRGLHTSPVRYFTDYLFKACLFVAMGAGCTWVCSFIPADSYLLVACMGAVSFILSSLIILLVYGRSQEFKYLWSVVKNLRSIMKAKSEEKSK